MCDRRRRLAVLVVAGLAFAGTASADRLELKDGTVVENCFLRDEGIRFLVWQKMADVGGPAKAIPRSQVKDFKILRDEAWDAHPNLPDLSVTFIELDPKLAGLHGRVNYESLGRPSLGGAKALVDLGERTVMEPEKAAANLKLHHTPGEQVTLTAHVKNVGFAPAKPFEFAWLIDGKELSKGACDKALKEMEETTFVLKWNWQEGMHTATFQLRTDQPEIATLNNQATDPLWGWGFEFVVNLKQFPQELIWYHQDHRFAVSTVGGLGLESELVETLAPPKN